MRDIEFWQKRLDAADADRLELKRLIEECSRRIMRARYRKASADKERRKGLGVFLTRLDRERAKYERNLDMIEKTKIPYFMGQIERLENLTRWQRLKRNTV